MPWLKRNLFLVAGGVAALALLSLAGFFLLSKIKLNSEVTAELSRQTDQLRRLATQSPHPNPDNIEAAKREQAKLEAFLADTRKLVAGAPPAPELNSQVFRREMIRTVNDLRRRAESSGVELPENFQFTFEAQQRATSFLNLEALYTHLTEVGELCRILFDARINSLVSLQRPPVADEEGFGTQYLDGKAETNQWAVITPYTVTIEGFSAELGRIMEGMARSRHFIVLKNLEVIPSAEAVTTDDWGMDMFSGRGMGPQANPYGLEQPDMMRGRGIPGRGQPGRGRHDPRMSPGFPGAAHPRAAAPRPELEEQLLRIKLDINVVKPTPELNGQF